MPQTTGHRKVSSPTLPHVSNKRGKATHQKLTVDASTRGVGGGCHAACTWGRVTYFTAGFTACNRHLVATQRYRL